MQFVDTMFLAWHSPEGIAAAGFAGMLAWTFSSLIIGTVGYTGVVTANNVGAGLEQKIGPSIWQGILLACVGGLLTFLASFATGPFFRLVGHDIQIQAMESTYLRILLMGGVFHYAQVALAGFFSGRGDNFRLMAAQLIGQLVNIILDYCLIFGKFGFPKLGVAGAALATVAAAFVSLLLMGFMFLRHQHRQRYQSHCWRPHLPPIRQLLRFGLPSGMQMATDASLWSIFQLVIGRIGTVELAATAIVFRLNMLAFMPVLGISRAMATLVGQCHGRRDSRGVLEYLCHGTVVCQLWMMAIALTYALFPEQYLALFKSDGGNIAFAEVAKTGVQLLRFVAIYCLADAINIALCSGLQAVGDTKWTSKVLIVASLILILILFYADFRNWGVMGIWAIVTVYIVVLPPVWYFRIRQGKWQKIRIVGQ